jgi:branched-chain amino acid transport system substrate-binding protein
METDMNFINLCRMLVAVCVVSASTGAQAQKNELVKVAVIDPLSGPQAVLGTNQLKTAEYFVGIQNRSRGANEPKYEIVGLDSKLDPTAAVAQLHKAIEQGVHYVIHGNGSGVALALVEALNKYNAANPGKEVLYFNHAAVDSTLTNEKCSFWHFRLDADVTMRLAVMTAFVKDTPSIKKVYLLNQDYSFGRQISKYAKEGLKAKRPDVEIVGDEFIPLSKIKDFDPIVEKIKASGADTVITGNWGTDMSLFAKASVDQGYPGRFLTFYADRAGAPKAFGVGGLGRVYVAAATHSNMGGMANLLAIRFKDQYNEDLQSFQIMNSLMLLNEGIKKARSTDPVKVATAIEGLSFEGATGMMTMRKQDHQAQQNMYFLVMGKTSEKYPTGLEGTDYTLVQEKYYTTDVASTSTICNMERPASAMAPGLSAAQVGTKYMTTAPAVNKPKAK